MNTTATRALQALRAIDWAAIGRRTIVAAQLLLMVVALAAEIIWEHRQQIRSALVHAIAIAVCAVMATYHAGRWLRHAIDRLSRRSIAVLPQQPVAALAPITATLQAAREALAQLIARLYPVPVLA